MEKIVQLSIWLTLITEVNNNLILFLNKNIFCEILCLKLKPKFIQTRFVLSKKRKRKTIKIKGRINIFYGVILNKVRCGIQKEFYELFQGKHLLLDCLYLFSRCCVNIKVSSSLQI